MIQVNRIYLIFNRLVTKKFFVDTSDNTLLFFPMLFSARLLLIAAIAFAEFYIPFVELSKIALSFVVFNVVFRSLV